jgi:hypothetical protein
MEEDMTTTPRALISAMQVTLDGYSHGAKDESDWVDSWADGLELLPPVDAFVLGGGMYPGYEQFWTTMLDNPTAASDMLGREPYPRELAYARVAAETPHLVLSNTLTEVRWPTAALADGPDRPRHRGDPHVGRAARQSRLCRRRTRVGHEPHRCRSRR